MSPLGAVERRRSAGRSIQDGAATRLAERHQELAVGTELENLMTLRCARCGSGAIACRSGDAVARSIVLPVGHPDVASRST